ncbi:hypothetical protein [Mucilaginibacter sp. PAMB04168]|uniref:hypothetical protein n=1 Tax=Mucilaginibacter sp. PAMB04168 TaxID=3138567 RepID=UPI0031F71F34
MFNQTISAIRLRKKCRNGSLRRYTRESGAARGMPQQVEMMAFLNVQPAGLQRSESVPALMQSISDSRGILFKEKIQQIARPEGDAGRLPHVFFLNGNSERLASRPFN